MQRIGALAGLDGMAASMRLGAVLAMVLALGGGCAHKQLTNRQVAIGVGAVVIAGVIIYAATQSHCEQNQCLDF